MGLSSISIIDHLVYMISEYDLHACKQDYVGDDVNVNNFFAVLLGNRTALTGGSGKVIDSGPDDYIFVYYTDHGGPGVLG